MKNHKEKRGKQISEIMHTVQCRNSAYIVLEYSKNRENEEHNILRYVSLMKRAAFLAVEDPCENEMISELVEFLGK